MVQVINYVRARGRVFFSERSDADLVRPRHGTVRMADQMQTRRFCVVSTRS
jgi:hypothetical protein